MATTVPHKASPQVRHTIWVRILMMFALVLAGILLMSNLSVIPTRLHGYLSSLPLAIAGIGYATLQLRVRPPLGTLLKRLLLAATFMIWAIDQLLPAGWLATLIGDVVIAAYVLDLYWLIQEQVSAVNSSSDAGALAENAEARLR
jgi:hypothetical protein